MKVKENIVEAIRLIAELDDERRQQRTETLLGSVFKVEKEEGNEL